MGTVSEENRVPVPAGRVELPQLRPWIEGKTGRKAHKTYRVRILVQSFFALVCAVLGIRLAAFYRAAQAGELPLPSRPPGVEGFLPISGLMGLRDWVFQGDLNTIHPAATILVLIALVMAVLLRKGFCSWVCPVGFLSELLARFGRWSFGRNFRIWSWLDVPLRSLKYLLMAFFLSAVVTMGADQLQNFINSPYNRVADLKMGLFFLDLGAKGTMIMGLLVLGSVFVQGFWCRYLCPYGAFLGIFSWISPTHINRNADPCVNCGICDKACMARLPVSKGDEVMSTECTGCLDCVAACPVPGALEVRTFGRRRLSALGFAAGVLGIFFAGYLGARTGGVWSNGISDQEYLERVPEIHSPAYGHPGA
jgi:ferredoxin